MDFFRCHRGNPVLALFESGFFVSKGVGRIIAGCVLCFASGPTLATTSAEQAASNERVTCTDSLNTLVSYLEETAQIEGQSLLVERKASGQIVLYYEDFLQHMRCLDGDLHIDTQDPAMTMPKSLTGAS